MTSIFPKAGSSAGRRRHISFIVDTRVTSRYEVPLRIGARRVDIGTETTADRPRLRELFPMTSINAETPKWPKSVPSLTDEQRRISDDFMKYWHEVLPRKYGVVETFNHEYAVKHAPKTFRTTLEIGAGLGEHLNYEVLTRRTKIRTTMLLSFERTWPKGSGKLILTSIRFAPIARRECLSRTATLIGSWRFMCWNICPIFLQRSMRSTGCATRRPGTSFCRHSVRRWIGLLACAQDLGAAHFREPLQDALRLVLQARAHQSSS